MATGLRSYWLLAALASALALLLLLVACGGDGEEAAPGAEATATEEAPADEGTPEDEATPADEGDGGGAAQLQSLARSTEGITAKVTYLFSSSAAGEQFEGTWTLTQRPPDSRIDMDLTGAGLEDTGTTTVIQTSDVAYLCTEFEGVGTCLSVPVDEADAQTALLEPFFDTTSSLAEDTEGFSVVNRTSETIAGISAECFEVESTALTEFASAKVCISDDGLLLLSRVSSDEGEFSIEATEASTDVGDSDFEPPFEVFEFEIPTP